MSRALTFAFAALLLASFGCRQSPSTPSQSQPAPVQVAGTWSGRFTETRCTGDAVACSARFKSGEPQYDFTLTLAQQDGRVTGAFDLRPRPGEAHANGEVTGTVQGRAIHLSGRLPLVSESSADVRGAKVIDNFDVLLNSDATALMNGSLRMIHEEGDVEHFRTEAMIVSLTKTSS